MDMKQIVMLALQVSIIATVFGFGLKSTVNDLLYVWRRPGLLARSLLAMLVIMPALAVVMARAFSFPRAVAIALIALAISPVPPLLPKKETKAGGLQAYGLGLMAVLGVLAIVTIPLTVELLERIFGVPLGIPARTVAGIALTTMVGPLVAGVLLRTLAPTVAERLAGPVGTLAAVLLPLAILPVLVVALPAAWRAVGDGTLVAIAVFVVVGLGVGHLLGGPEPGHAGVLALATAARHPALAFAVASANFPQERFGGAIVLYLVVTGLLSLAYIKWQAPRAASAVASR